VAATRNLGIMHGPVKLLTDGDIILYPMMVDETTVFQIRDGLEQCSRSRLPATRN
jgi:hypothetical protein